MFGAKIFPVVEAANTIEIGSYVRIHNFDDDMHNKKGIFKGHFEQRSTIFCS